MAHPLARAQGACATSTARTSLGCKTSAPKQAESPTRSGGFPWVVCGVIFIISLVIVSDTHFLVEQVFGARDEDIEADDFVGRPLSRPHRERELHRTRDGHDGGAGVVAG